MKYIVDLAKMLFYLGDGISPIILVVAFMTLVEDVWHYYTWYIVACVFLLNLLFIRLICWLLAMSITILLCVLLNQRVVYRRLLAMVALWLRGVTHQLRRHYSTLSRLVRTVLLLTRGNISEKAFSLRAAEGGSK